MVTGGEGRRGNIGVQKWEIQTTGYKIVSRIMAQVQHGAYSQHFVTGVGGKSPLKIV